VASSLLSLRLCSSGCWKPVCPNRTCTGFRIRCLAGGQNPSANRLPVEPLSADQGANFARIVLGEEAPAELPACVGRPTLLDTHRSGAFSRGRPVAAQMTVAGRVTHLFGVVKAPCGE